MSQLFRNMLTSLNGIQSERENHSKSNGSGKSVELCNNGLAEHAAPSSQPHPHPHSNSHTNSHSNSHSHQVNMLNNNNNNNNNRAKNNNNKSFGIKSMRANRLVGKMIGRFQSLSVPNANKNCIISENTSTPSHHKNCSKVAKISKEGELMSGVNGITQETNGEFDGDEDADEEDDEDKENVALPEELCDLPSFLQTKNCDSRLIGETRRLLRERYAKKPDSFYDHDYERMLTDDWTVTRFLLRRRLDPKRTAKLMEECGLFRKLYKMSEVKLWEFPIEFHQVGGLFHYEPDRVGNVTVYMRTRMYRRVPELSDVFKAFVLCVLEEADCANKGRGVAVIFDLTGCGLQNVDLAFLSWLLSSFRNYCPKGVSYIMVYNLPWFLNATAKLAMGWLSSSNRRALRFVHGAEIESFIARENLPDYLGGTSKRNYRAIPDGSRPAVEVCDRLEMSPEQALKIRDMFTQYLPGDDHEAAAPAAPASNGLSDHSSQATNGRVVAEPGELGDEEDEFHDCEQAQSQSHGGNKLSRLSLKMASSKSKTKRKKNVASLIK